MHDMQISNLSGCARVYIDLGTNVGDMLRRVYEPERFRQGWAQDIFGRNRSDPSDHNRSDVCALAFEPVPATVARAARLCKSAFCPLRSIYRRACFAKEGPVDASRCIGDVRGLA